MVWFTHQQQMMIHVHCSDELLVLEKHWCPVKLVVLDEDVDIDAAETAEMPASFLQESEEAWTGQHSATGCCGRWVGDG